MRRALPASVLLLACACGCVHHPAVEHLTLEPVVIRVGPSGTSAETPDPELDRLSDLQEKGKCEEAIPGFERFVEDFPESSRWIESVYRLGACEEVVGHLERARGYYRFVAARTRGEAHAQAAGRAAYTLETMGHLDAAEDEYAAIVSARDATPEARTGARLRQTVCLFRQGRMRAGRRALDDGLSRFGTLDSPPDSVRASAAEARFALAEALAKSFDAVKLEYPQRTLEKRLQEKIRITARARDAYTDVVAIKDPEWAAAAVFRMGELYERFYRELVALPAPGGLDAGQRAAYVARVEEKAKPLKQQAFDAYVRVSTLGERVGLDDEWVARSRERIKALEPELEHEVLSSDPSTAPAAPTASPTPAPAPAPAPDVPEERPTPLPDSPAP